MNKERLYILISVGLLISNVLLVSLMLINSKKGHDLEGPRNLIIEKLKYDEDQIVKYDALISVHRRSVKAENEKIYELKEQLYILLQQEPNSQTADSIINEIASQQRIIEEINFNHFKEIKKLCRKDQNAAFNELSFELAKLFSPKRP